VRVLEVLASGKELQEYLIIASKDVMRTLYNERVHVKRKNSSISNLFHSPLGRQAAAMLYIIVVHRPCLDGSERLSRLGPTWR
jgi:hypothetical protein